MKLHSDTIQISDIHKALGREIEAGRIAPHVSFKIIRQEGSRIRKAGFEVQLEADKRDNGRRFGNSGSYGATSPWSQGYEVYAATYDEWGWLIAALYDIDEDALWGSGKYPQYKNREDFDEKTGLTYNPKELLPLLIEGHWPTFVDHDDYTGGDPYPYTSGYTANRVGRRGFGRITEQAANDAIRRGWTRHLKRAPRDPEVYRAFAHLTEDALV